MTNFSKTLIRCSAIGSIMRKPKGSITENQIEEIRAMELKSTIKSLTAIQQIKLDELIKKRDMSPTLSDTCKTYLIQTYALEKYNRIQELKTKPVMKGINAEEAAIDLFGFVEDRPYYKNTQRLKNEFISGTPDLFDGPTIEESEEVIDIKCAYDIWTFLKNVAVPHNPMYYWQLQGYMALTGAKRGTLAYCLVDMPEEMINEEKKRLFYKMECATEESPEYLKAVAKMERNMFFQDIPPDERVLKFFIDRNDEDIAKIDGMVKLCRDFLCEFEEQHKYFTKGHRREAKKLLSLSQSEE